jgi:acyl-CoA thioesterase-1
MAFRDGVYRARTDDGGLSALPRARRPLERHLLIRVYGDSLSLPRFSDGVRYRQTFPELLRLALAADPDGGMPDLYNRSKPAATAPQLLSEYERDSTYFGPEDDQILIVQCGVCDCAPRPVPRWLRPWIGRLPVVLRRTVIGFLHANRSRLLRAGFAWREVDPQLFRSAVRLMLEKAAGSARAVLVLNIAPTTAAMDAHSPGFARSIEEYNGILHAEVLALGCASVRLVDVHQAIVAERDGVTRYVNQVDGHHITPDGHLLYAHLLLSAIDALGDQHRSNQCERGTS